MLEGSSKEMEKEESGLRLDSLQTLGMSSFRRIFPLPERSPTPVTPLGVIGCVEGLLRVARQQGRRERREEVQDLALRQLEVRREVP